MDSTGQTFNMAQPKYYMCHMCEKTRPVESVAMLCCWDLKEVYQDPVDRFWYMEYKDLCYRVPIGPDLSSD